MTYTTETNHTQTVTGNRDFSVGFPFLATTDLKVQLNGTTKTLTNDYTIVQSGANTTINFNTAPADNATIRIFRDTDIDAIEATYAAGSSIRARDLNTNNTQLLYAAQEFGTLKSDNSVSFTLGDKGDIAVNSSTDWTLQNNSVEIANMADNSVGTNELVNDCVTNDKMANNAVETAMILNNSVTNPKIADDALGSRHYSNGSINPEHLAPTAGLNPVGTVIWYAGSTAPVGYLKANGDAIANGSGTTQSITADFSALYAIVGANLPDLRGEFVRGWDDGKGTDSGRSIRSSQSNQNKQHNHTATSSSSSSTATTSITGTFGNDPHNYTPTGVFSGSSQTFNEDQDQGNNGQVITLDASHNHTTTTTTTTSIANEGGNEARPRNIALLACIKY